MAVTYVDGGVRGVSNDPTSSVASGRWSLSEVFGWRTTGTWPLSPLSTNFAVAFNGSPNLQAYPFAAGFGTKYADPSLPAVLSNLLGLHFSPSGEHIACSGQGAPFVAVFQFLVSGFGSKLADPVTLPSGNISRSVKFSPTGADIAVLDDVAPKILTYPFAAGFGTKYADPSPVLPGRTDEVSFSPFGDTISISTATAGFSGGSPFINVYSFSAGFGTKFTNPAILPTGSSRGNAFTFNNIAVAHEPSPHISAYPFTTGFGTKYTDPASPVGFTANKVDFTPDGSDLAISGGTSPFVAAYPFSSGFGTRYANPATLPAGSAHGIRFSRLGADIAVAHNVTPFMSVYPFAAGFGTKYADPAAPLSDNGRSVAFN